MDKFDLNAAIAALRWIESVNGKQLGKRDVGQLQNEREVAELLKDGTALCEVMNHIKPGAIKKYHQNPSAFQQMENAELFLKACIDYGMQVIDTFPVKELYEARAVYTVINCIYALGSLAQQNGYTGPKLGVKISTPNERHFNEEQLQEARRTVSRQHVGLIDGPSQAKMTPYGLPRQILLSGSSVSDVAASSHTIIGLQYGSNQVASQSGMTAYGMPRQISISSDSDHSYDVNNPADNNSTVTNNNPLLTKSNSTGGSRAKIPSTSTVIGLQYGSNKVASQSGMTAYGMPRQIVSSAMSGQGFGEKDSGDVFDEENKR